MITLLPPFRANSMQGLSQKVVRGQYEPIASHYTSDLKEMVKKLLQVNPKNRPSCDEILSTHGLLNHITGTLENLDVAPESVPVIQDLLSTIRCPRNLGQITDRLPKSQYSPTKLKRSNSMAIETENNLREKTSSR